MRGIANAAAQLLATSQVAYRCGVVIPSLHDNLVTVQQDLGKLLALFEDGAGYGQADDGILWQLRCMEQMAADLLEAIEDDEQTISADGRADR